MTLKNQLLKPMAPVPVKRMLLGSEFPLQRLTAARLSCYDKEIKEYEKAADGEKIQLISASLILDSILDEKGKPMSDSVTPEQLLNVHTAFALSSAVQVICKLNYMDDGAEDEAKNV
ncbi:hypothetical protein [Vibrio fluvialis]|uniref:hypothetical protein n=1 Tax=Vibrio fluvialis TaxID=676 RepID=UPI00399B068A